MAHVDTALATKTVAVVLSSSGRISSIYQSAELARAKVAQYNADPFVDGEPDPDAPYSVQVWGLFDALRDNPLARCPVCASFGPSCCKTHKAAVVR